MKHPALPPQIPVARYNNNLRQVRYAGNPLIEALPAPKTEEQLIASLEFLPPFDPSSRDWENHDRLRELLSVANIMVPLSSHIQLATVLDSMLREGYVGRRPNSREHAAIYQEIYEEQQRGGAFRQTYDTLTPQLSTALVGVSGMGKTTTVKRCLAHIPRVIYHPELDLYQIPWLHFEMPGDGKGVKALLTSIIEAIAELIPNNTYSEDYVKHSRESVSSMQSSVRRLLNKHCVGLLIPDEVQNVANTRKADQIVMTELTTLANKSRTPVLFIGTNKAQKILSLDFRQARRAIGLGLGDWGPLPRYDESVGTDGTVQKEPGEWVDFMTELWTYCWVRRPVQLDERLLDVFYDCTQGVLDLAIKLFAVSQARAIFDGSETLSEQLIRAVYDEQFKLIHPMVEALRSDDLEALIRFEDVTPLKVNVKLEDMMDDLSRRYRRRRSHAASTRPGNADFQLRLQETGKAMGLSPEDAEAIAQQIAQEATAKDMVDAVAQLTRKLSPPKRVRSTKANRPDAATAKSSREYPGLEDRPLDYRNAIVAADKEGSDILTQLVRLKMIPEPEDVICLA
jgi:hypothetical protein